MSVAKLPSLGRWLVVFFSLSSLGFGAVPKEHRALIFLSDLESPAAEKNRWFYEQADRFFASETERTAVGAYARVLERKKEEATLSGLAKALSDVASDPRIEAIDAVIELHGAPHAIVFHEGAHATAEIRDLLRAEPKLFGKLRALYSGACYGSSHNADWLAAGFKVVSGARRVNTNGVFDYPTLLRAWIRGAAYADAQAKANAPRWISFYDELAFKMGLGNDNDSFKVTSGDGSLSIESLPR